MDQKYRQASSGSRNIQPRFEEPTQQYYPSYTQDVQHFQTVEEINIETRQQVLQQQQMEFINYKGHSQKRQSFSRPPTSKQHKNDKPLRTLADNSYIDSSLGSRVPLSQKCQNIQTIHHTKNISAIPTTEISQINHSLYSHNNKQQRVVLPQGKENMYVSKPKDNHRKELTLDFKTLGDQQSSNTTYVDIFPDSTCRNTILLNMSKDSCEAYNQSKPCATQRTLSSHHSNINKDYTLQNLTLPQHPKTIGKDNASRERSVSKIKLNTRQFVKNVIQSQVFDLTYKDQVFSKHLKYFITESEQFLQNNEKHYRIKYVMDLVQALITSVHSYIEDGGKTDRVLLEKQAFLKEKERFQKKVQKHKAQEADLKDKMQDFENVFSLLTDMRLSVDEDKKEFIAAYVKKYNLSLLSNNIEKNREDMSQEDERARFLREVERIKQKESQANEEIIRIKQEQNKLSEDIQEFIQIKDQFERQKALKQEQFAKMKQSIQERFRMLESEAKEKEEYFKKYEFELKQREKILTDLILNNQTDSCQNENLMMSFNKTLNMGSIDESYKQLNFDHFLDQFESHKDELILREQALNTFLNRNDSKRTSYTIESLRSSYQMPLSQQQQIKKKEK